MTLTNQKDQNNQSDRNISVNRFSNNNNLQNQSNQVTESSTGNNSTEEHDKVKEQERQIYQLAEEVIEEQVEDKKITKKPSKSISIESVNETSKPQQTSLETPKDTTSKKIFELADLSTLDKDQNVENEASLDNLSNSNQRKQEVSNPLSKTPPHNENQLVMQAVASFILSPLLFKKKQESRFQFAHSVDPGFKYSGNDPDWDEIEVPAKIQDLIEKNIRTLSNSMSSKGLNTNENI